MPLQILLLRSNSEPVSPINTFAGCKLNIKNPKVAPITILPNIEISGRANLIPIIVKHVIIIAETLEHSPSIPSVRFTAFVVPRITTIANGIYKNIGIFIYCFTIGIYVSVPNFNPYIKYTTYATEIINNPNIL